MKKVLVKSLVTGIVFLFIGTSVISGTGNVTIGRDIRYNNLDGNTLYVGGTGPGNYSRIQDAIEDASNGDMIYVYNGTYYENVVVDKPIELIAEDKDTTIIDGSGSDSVIKIITGGATVSGFTIQNSKNSSTAAGVYINSDGNAITGNIIARNKGSGIYITSSSNNVISGNVITKNYYDGIHLESSPYTTITENIISNHSYTVYQSVGIPLSHGVYLKESSHTTVSDNTFINNINYDAMFILSSYLMVTGNTFSNSSGILLSGGLLHWITHTIENNYIDNKPIYYYKNKNGITVPSDAAEVILANCQNFKIQNLSISGGDVAILLGFSSNNIISDNTISNVLDGIFLIASDYNTISRNNVYNVYGNPLFSSSNNTVSHNIIKDNIRYGLGLWYSSSNNTIYGNTIINNGEDGLFIYESCYNTIAVNTIKNNEESGIEEYSKCSHNTISGNTIADNADYGIKVTWSSNDNFIHHNNFVNNTPDNARDVCSNSWDDGIFGGNYWSDYNGEDLNGDGFGDEPYVIAGGNNKDCYPQLTPIDISPPEKPAKPSGTTSGKPRKEYIYTTNTTDPNGDKVYYKWDWGDGTTSGWLGPYDSGQIINATHKWKMQGNYNIRVKAKDITGAESEWSDPLPVSLPKNKIFDAILLFLERLMEQFPLLKKVL